MKPAINYNTTDVWYFILKDNLVTIHPLDYFTIDVVFKTNEIAKKRFGHEVYFYVGML